jgi:FkbM family methyltransferase
MFNIGDKVHRNVLLNCDHGLMIVNRFDSNHEQVGHGQWLLDHGNASTVEAYHCVRALDKISNPVVFDVGGNIGTFATWIARTFPQGRIHCFEPQHAVFQQLAGNMAINNLYNVFTHNMALGAENKHIQFNQPDYFAKHDFGTFSLKTDKHLQRTAETLTVEVRTLDSFMQVHQIRRLDLLKIDAEGMDLEVLAGAEQTIRRYVPKIFVEHSDNEVSIKHSVIEFLSQFGYEFEIIGNNILAK